MKPFALLLCALLPLFVTANDNNKTIKRIRVNQSYFYAIHVLPEKTTLHWKDHQDNAYQYFATLKSALTQQGKTPIVLMNAGIYGINKAPAGLHIEHSQLKHSLNTHKGKGNFHLEPNGVFFINQHQQANILTTTTFRKHHHPPYPSIRLATQSGPMLVIHGKINSRLLPKSTSHYTRNGVCTTKTGKLIFIASDGVAGKSNLYTFAQASKQLKCYNTLYLDGNISKLYIHGHQTTFHLPQYVGILAVEQ